MNITLKEIINAQSALAELATFKFKGKTGYDNAKLLKKCGEELDLYTKARQSTIEKYGVFDEQKGGYTFPTLEGQKAMTAEAEELMAEPVTLECSKLAFADVAAQDPTTGFWAALDWAIAEPIA